MAGHEWWYLARATGIVAFALVSASVVWGLLLSTRLFGRAVKVGWLRDLHRFLGGLTVLFVGAHIAALVADHTVHFGPREVLVPMTSSWQPGAVTWGVVAAYLLVAVELTSLAMRRLPRRIWRGVHLTSFVVFVSGAVHGALAGTDASSRLYGWFGLGVVWAVLFLSLVRVLATRPARAPRPSAAMLDPNRRSAYSSGITSV